MTNNAIDPNAIFVFAFSMDTQSTRDFGINLISWAGKNATRPLRININSIGGNFHDCLYLFEEIGRLRAAGHHVTIAAYGRAASCSGWFLQCADRRIMGPNSWLLIHEVSSRAEGTISEVKLELARMEQLHAQSVGLLTGRTGGKLTAEEIDKNISGGRDWWLDAKTALEKGLVDEIESVPSFSPVSA